MRDRFISIFREKQRKNLFLGAEISKTLESSKQLRIALYNDFISLLIGIGIGSKMILLSSIYKKTKP